MSPQEVKLPYLNKISNRHHRGLFFYHYRRGGRNVRIEGDVGSTAWHENYQAIHSSSEDEGREPGKRLSEDIFCEVVKAYMASLRFQRLKETTKTNYRYALAKVMPVFGDLPIGRINARHLSELRDKIAENSPRKAMETMKVLRLVFSSAYERAIIERNPCAGVGNPIGYKAKPWRPWTLEEIETFRVGARPVWRRAMMVLLFTGQRRADAINLRRDKSRTT